MNMHHVQYANVRESERGGDPVSRGVSSLHCLYNILSPRITAAVRDMVHLLLL